MKLNGISLGGYRAGGDEVTFSLNGCTIEEAAALDGETLTVTNDEGEVVEVFEGYVVASVSVASGSVRVRAIRRIEESAEAAISALEENVRLVRETATATQAVANEAKQTAEGAAASASPAVRAASALYVNASTTLTNSQLGDVRDLIEDFVQGAEYAKGSIRRYDGKFWRMAQKITSTTSQTYLPGTGTESLYTLIDLAPDGIRVWHAPTDATNSFALGERAHYPDADGPIYVSGREGNTSEPGTDEWWTLAED